MTIRYFVAALIAAVALTGCTPPPAADLVGTVHYRHGAEDVLQIRRGASIYAYATVTPAQYAACQIGDLWPDCGR